MSALDKVRLTARRFGVPEDLAVSVAFNESRGNQGARSPAGAIGVMQLMPDTARGLGVDPHNEDQNIEGGVRYLKQQLDTFGDPRLAVAAYNAGPGAVQRHGGVPPYAETQKYVGNVMGGQSGADIFGLEEPRSPQGATQSGADIFGMGEPPAGAKPAPAAPPALPPGLGADAAHPIVLTTANRDQIPEGAFFRTSLGEVRQQKKGSGYTPDAPKVPQRNAPMDGTLGLVSGAQKGMAGVADSMLSAFPIVGPALASVERARTGSGPIISMTPPVLSIMAKVAAANGFKPQTEAGKVMETVGTMLPNAAIPGSVPQRVLSVVAPAFGQEAAQRGAKAAGLDENGQQIAGVLGAAAGGLATGLRMGETAKLPKADLGALYDAKKALYGKVEASGFTFSPGQMRDLADGFTTGVREMGGPKAAQLVPAADAMASRLKALAGQKGGVTLSQLDKLRSDIYSTLISKGGAEAAQGYKLRSMIDGLMDSSKAPFIRQAREANTRWEKVKDVTERITSADLGAASTNSGQNVVNRTRQKLRPMIDPMSSDFVPNLTPDEAALANRVVRGDGKTNTLRGLSNLFRNKIVTGAAGTTIGASTSNPLFGMLTMAGLEGAGQMAKGAAERTTRKQIDQLLSLMAAGGVAPKPAPPITWASTQPYAGAAGVTAPFLAALPAAAQSRPPQKARRP